MGHSFVPSVLRTASRPSASKTITNLENAVKKTALSFNYKFTTPLPYIVKKKA